MRLENAFIVGMVCFWVWGLTGCTPKQPVFPEEPPYFNWIQDTAIDNFSSTGRVYFWPSPTAGGIKIEIVLTGNLPLKRYYAQIHDTGSCKNQGESSGPVFNPSGSKLFWNKPEGFLGTIKIPSDGPAHFSTFNESLNLGPGAHNIAGKSIIISKDKKGIEKIGCAVIPVPSQAKKSED